MADAMPITRRHTEAEMNRFLPDDLGYLFEQYPHKKPSRKLLQQISLLKNDSSSWAERMQVVEDVLRMISDRPDREEVKFTLELMIIFLEVSLRKSRYGLLGYNDGVRLPCIAIQRLMEAMNELDRGLVDPVLKPKKIRNRPPDSQFVTRFKTDAAAACEILIMSGETRARAASKVAKWASSCKLIGDRSFTPETILAWRKRFRKDRSFEYHVVQLSNMQKRQPRESLFSLMDRRRFF
jgi:hypothetical protein